MTQQNNAMSAGGSGLSGRKWSRQPLTIGSTTEPVTENLSPMHRKFAKFLVKSIDPQFVVARWLHCQGYGVSIKGLNFADKASSADSFSDGGDIRIKEGIIDVKHLTNVAFTSEKDFPYPVATAGFKPSIDKLLPDLYAAIFVSKDLGHGYIVLADTREHWTVRDVKDAVTGRMKPSYFVGLPYCRFIDLLSIPEWLENVMERG